MWDAIKLILLGFVMLFAGLAAQFGRDLAYQANALTIVVAAGITFLWVLRGVGDHRPVRHDQYMDDVVRAGVIATAFWGIVGFAVGAWIAFQLAFPQLNPDWAQGILNFGRLRPLHTSAVVFAFGGNALIMSSFYIVQRTSAVRLWGGNLGWFVFWGYQLFIVLAAVGYVLGATQGKEYAEPVWYVDIWLTVVWVAFLATFMGTLMTRREPHIYVANWFLLSMIITVAMLHLVNSMAVPVSILGSIQVQLTSGVQDAMIQWWYGHNAVGFFLTAGFLGMMYYFVPKQAERPVYSYKLSIIHFWALIFLYIWAGPHHLHYTALPEWAATLGMVFSIILWMPSWGGMINGLMTLSGAWDKLRDDPILRFLIVSLSFYGMSTFEGPMMSIKTVNALSHYTDWTVGHVHSGALGWVGLVTMGSMYYLIPRLFGQKKMYSVKAIEIHFWTATLGIVIYIAAMWIAGVMQGLMWRAVNADGTLTYTFVESVKATYPFYVLRLLGGLLYLGGMVIMLWNVIKTATVGRSVDVQIPAPAHA